MFKFLFKLKFLGFVEAPVGVFEYMYAIATRVSDYVLCYLGTIPVEAYVPRWYVRRLQWK